MYNIIIEANLTAASRIYHSIKRRNCVMKIEAPVVDTDDPEVSIITATTTLSARDWDFMFCSAEYSKGYISVTEV